MSNREEARYVISVAAEMSGMHPQTLRIYERRGLIVCPTASPYIRDAGPQCFEQFKTMIDTVVGPSA